ncbi:MAG: glycosyltransferase family 2 protein [Rhodobacteraceae bacterium]|nr:glycosyltransferase family 2 protein [Paracoccaceae bacterium]
MQTVAAVTMVRDDAFFLNAWLKHYGEMFGRENCYVINHGRGDVVNDLAKGCNIIGIPGDPHKAFDMKRWALLNGIVSGLRRYYRHVIVGDVDELVICDPAHGTLMGYLEEAPEGRVVTPVGMEIIHRIDKEPDPITDHIIGPRRHVRPALHYAKPCIVSAPVKLSRGGHFAKYKKLHVPETLYVVHLKFCDFAEYSGVMDARNAMTADTGVGVKEAAIGGHWFSEARGEDKAVFEAFADLKLIEEFNFARFRRKMQRTFRPRGETGYYQFDRPDFSLQYILPERFIGVI